MTFARLACLLRGHDWGHWHLVGYAVATELVRRRCKRCGKPEYDHRHGRRA